jgi:tellurite methyltransferase
MSKTEEWNERYQHRKHLKDRPSPLLRRIVQSLRPGRALEIACGAGRNALFLAARGWNVQAVDGSEVAIRILRERAKRRGLSIDAQCIDLESGKFSIQKGAYDLICIFFYLQRNLFPAIRNGLRKGGYAVAAIHTIEDSPGEKPRNPAFLLQPAELAFEFQGWKILHYGEGKASDKSHRRRTAEIIAMKP